MNTVKATRSDGQATKEKLLTCAGQLVATQGFSATTSKQICEKAGENMAAVNYYFGSRNGLYKALLESVYHDLFSLSRLKEIERSGETAEEKLNHVVHDFFMKAVRNDSWQMKLWIREILHPSELLEDVLEETGIPKITVLLRLISDYTGIPKGDAQLFTALLCFMSPFAMAALGKTERLALMQVAPDGYSFEREKDMLIKAAFASLQSFCR